MTDESSGHKRKINSFKLNALLEITKAINNNESTEELLLLFENILFKHLGIGKIALFSSDKGWTCIASRGISPEQQNLDVESKLLKIKDITEGTIFSTDSVDVIVPVYHKTQALAYLIIGDVDENKMEMSAAVKHLPYVQTLTNIICVAIENKKLAKENIGKISVRKELELASQMQNMLFPSELPSDNFINIDAYYRPHHEVGGDYYDLIRINENEIIFCIADVSGKGISAALLMANFQANLRAEFKHSRKLSEILLDLNPIVIKNAKSDKYITLFVAHYHCVTRVLTYVNAGHNPPMLRCNGMLQRLTSGCIGLGMLEEIPTIKEGVINIDSGSILTCYTDGLTEQSNVLGEEYGEQRLAQQLLSLQSGISGKEINNVLVNDFLNFTEGNKIGDDVTLFTCTFN